MFAEKSVEFRQECAALGLFEARAPRFSQLFFHNSTDSGTVQPLHVETLGQSKTATAVSRSAAQAYLRSGVRLQSSCGMSDSWYSYVESNADLFTQVATPAAISSAVIPPGSDGPFHPLIATPPQSFHHQHSDSQRPEPIRQVHDQQRAKNTLEVPADEPDYRNGDGPSNDTTLPLSKALESCDPHPADAADRQDEQEDAHSTGVRKEEHKVERLTVAEGKRVEGALELPKAMEAVEPTDAGSDGYEFDEEWPTTGSFYKAMDVMEQEYLQAKMHPVSAVPPSCATGGHGPGETTELPKGQTKRARASSKRPRQNSNACESSQSIPPTRC